MKRLKIETIGILIIFLLVSLTSLSQNSQNQVKIKKIEPIKIPDGLQHSQNKIRKDDWNLVDYQFKVDEIQKKIDWVNSNPEETKKANANNWFETAYKVLKDAKIDRDLHIEKFGYKIIHGFPQLISTGNPEKDRALYDKNLAKWINAHPETQKNHNQ